VEKEREVRRGMTEKERRRRRER